MTTMLVAYDISQNARRARVAASLQAWGNRLQRSVYLCTSDDSAADQLHYVTSQIDPKSDVLHAFTLCSGCLCRVAVKGQASLSEPALWIV